MTLTLPPARYRAPEERPSSSLRLRATALELTALAQDSRAFPALGDRVEIRRDAQTVRLTAVLLDEGGCSSHYAAAMQDASTRLLDRLTTISEAAR